MCVPIDIWELTTGKIHLVQKTEKEKKKERAGGVRAWVCGCVCERERENESPSYLSDLNQSIQIWYIRIWSKICYSNSRNLEQRRYLALEIDIMNNASATSIQHARRKRRDGEDTQEL